METCPGCNRPMTMTGMGGIWIAPDGTMQVYALCVPCTEVVRSGGAAEEAIMENIEQALRPRPVN